MKLAKVGTGLEREGGGGGVKVRSKSETERRDQDIIQEYGMRTMWGWMVMRREGWAAWKPYA